MRAVAMAVVVLMSVGGGAAGADTGSSNGATYVVSTTPVDIGSGWKAVVGQVTGGDPAVRDAFNAASIASGTSIGDLLRSDGMEHDKAEFDTTPVVGFRPTAVSQVLTGTYYQQGAAHPLGYVRTVVIDSRDAHPITLGELFSDQQAGLDRLSAQTKLQFPDGPGSAPVAANFHNWIPAAGGLEIHFEDYQFAHGLPVITVPWAKLVDVLAPNMRVLAR